MNERSILNGIGASEGIAIGRAFRYGMDQQEENSYPEMVDENQIESEIERVHAAKQHVHDMLERILEANKDRYDEKQVAIIKGHQGLLADPALKEEIEKLIRTKQYSAERAVQESIQKFVTVFQSMNQEYMRERAQDLQDIGGRWMDALLGKERISLAEIREQRILVAHDVTPSDAIQINPDVILGFITEIGGKTSHTAILAKSLGIPAIVGAGNSLQEVKDGDLLILDGENGRYFVNPDEETLEKYEQKRKVYLEEKALLDQFQGKPALSADGYQVEMCANIGSVANAQAALDSGAEGVGLFRTEFMYMDAHQMPSEDQQFDIYKQILSMWGDKPVVIRTLDIGGDKELPYLPLDKEMNPFLGYRAIRIGLNQPDVLRVQLRAILRASAFGNGKIMFPMISSLEEWRKAKSMVEEMKSELDAVGIAYNKDIEVGIMAEIPSVVQLADLFAKEVDFFSIGTNDLVQYTLAVDRMNEKVSYLYDYLHPAVIRSVRTIIQAAHQHGKWVGMCGGMAGDPLAAPILLGLGLDEWSMEAGAINRVKAQLAKMKKEDCEKWMDSVLACTTSEEVRQKIHEMIQK